MRKAFVFGAVLVCISLISFLAVSPVERKIVSPAGTVTPAAAKPSQVEVTNFPPVQPVNGTMNVGNLPAVQAVSGTVSVGNLPIDGNGHILVAVSGGSKALTLHSTTATYTGDLGGRTGATQKCRAEFSESHFPTATEIQAALNDRGIVWLVSETDWSWLDDQNNPSLNCREWTRTATETGDRIDGNLIREKGTKLFNGGPCSDAHPIICAE